ncbi:MAG: hypothetical protein WBV23_15040 [Desulfobaccales bacterium]
MQFISLLLIGVLTLGAAWPAAADSVGQDNREVQAVADHILDTVLKGLNEGECEVYCQYFDDRMKKVTSPNNFSHVRGDMLKSIGGYESRSYLGYLEKGKTTVVLWKGRFAKSADDVLIKLVLSRQGGQIKVSGLLFQ